MVLPAAFAAAGRATVGRAAALVGRGAKGAARTTGRAATGATKKSGQAATGAAKRTGRTGAQVTRGTAKQGAQAAGGRPGKGARTLFDAGKQSLRGLGHAGRPGVPGLGGPRAGGQQPNSQAGQAAGQGDQPGVGSSRPAGSADPAGNLANRFLRGASGAMRAGVLGPEKISRRLWRQLSPRQRVAIEREHQKKKGQRNRRMGCLPLLLLVLLLVPFCAGIFGIEEMEQSARAAMEAQNQTNVAIRPDMLPEVSRRTGIPTCAPDNPPDCIPALESYSSAAAAHQIDWTILAAIGKRECNHGRGACKRGMINDCGARGPMQFLGNTWRTGTDAVRSGDCPGSSHFTGDPIGPPIPSGQESKGYATDGNGDGTADPWVFPDATHSAGRMLVHNGLKENPARALLRYNESQSYVDGVLADAAKYREDVSGLDLAIRPGAIVAGAQCPVQPLGSTLPFENSMTTPATKTMANSVIACFGRGGQTISCYEARTPDLFEHPRGRACDIAITTIGRMPSSTQEERGRQMAEWVAANARELNVLYVVWYDHWWPSHQELRPWSEWDYYNSCDGGRAGPTTCHRDHVHVSVRLMPGDPSHARCPHSDCTENW